MRINQRIQDDYSSSKLSLWIEFPDGSRRETDCTEIEIIHKDIRFIRHELANYSYLYASQFSFGSHLNKNYWEFLKLKGDIPQHERDEIEEGVLLVIYLYYVEIFEAEGWSFLFRENLFETVNVFLKNFIPDNKRKKKILDCILLAIQHYKDEKMGDRWTEELGRKDKKLKDSLHKNQLWVHRTFVEEYFISIANSFEPMKERSNKFHEWLKKNAKQ